MKKSFLYLHIFAVCFAAPLFAESRQTSEILRGESAATQPAGNFSRAPRISKAQPVLESQTAGGCLYKMGEQKLLVLSGDPYTVGYAHGKLLAGGVKRNVDRVLKFIAKRKKSDDLKNAWVRLKPFIPERYMQEMKGLSDGSGVPLEKVQLANVFPELFHCSGFAVFGKATKTGELYHGRVLDYMTALDFQKDAVTFLVRTGDYNRFVNVGYAGLIGSVTGMNEKQVAIGQMGGEGAGQWDGLAMSLLMRTALEEASTLDEALEIYKKTPRTCEHFYVFSDGKTKDARAVHATPDEFLVCRPGQLVELRGIKFQFPPDTVMVSGPPRLMFLKSFILLGYGRLTVISSLALMNRPVAMESNLHDVLFVPAKLELFAANAADPKKIKDFQACYQTYQFYNVEKLLPLLDAVPQKK